MPRPPKIMLNKSVIFVTTSLEEGLLLPPNPLINLILEATLARAQTLHPVKASHFLFEPNHGHLLLTVDNPDDVPAFMERFKTESAHAINKLLGRRKRTIWCEGYDSPALLTLSTVINKIAYIYSNPSNDGLVHSINDYPGISSFEAWSDESKHIKKVPRLRRPMIQCLDNIPHGNKSKIADKLIRKAKSQQELKITPNEWMKSFGITDKSEIDEINKQIKEQILATEEANKVQRAKEGKGVLGRDKLINSPMNLNYRSERSGRRMLCISDDPHLRKVFISAIRSKIEEAKEIFKKWKMGDYSHTYPPGLFPPSMPKVWEAYLPPGCVIV